LVKTYNAFYQSVPILIEADETVKKFRIQLSEFVALTVENAFSLLGIDVPNRM
jgi:arginyl-tRNA synthetase